MSSPIDPLDLLLKDALVQQACRRNHNQALKQSSHAEEIKSFQSTYTNPANWQHERNLALIHKSSAGLMTLLGTFAEHTHLRKKGVRKLTRVEGIVEIFGEEIVMGDWWLRAEVRERISPSEEVEDIHLTLPEVSLKSLHVFAHSVSLRIRLLRGAIFRVELMSNTQFIDPTNNHLFFFPPGLDILDGMSFESKIAMRKQLDHLHDPD